MERDPQRTDLLEIMLRDISKGRHWPTGNNKPGDDAEKDFVHKAKCCIGLMMHCPVTNFEDDKWMIHPLSPLPEGAIWKDMIGFDPHALFSPQSIKD